MANHQTLSVLSTVELLGVRIASVTPAAALAEIDRLYRAEAPAMVAYVNAHTLNLAAEDPAFAAVLRDCDLVLNDGKGTMLAALLLGKRFPADLNGNYFTPLVLEQAAARGWPVFFLGAAEGVAATAARRLEARIPGLIVAGCRNGYFSAEEEPGILTQIRSTGAGLLLVALGNPKQESWLRANLAATGARLGIGVGAFFDFQARRVQRAPGWMNWIGLEWLHRLVVEPRRMWRRYLVGNPLFLARVLRGRP